MYFKKNRMSKPVRFTRWRGLYHNEIVEQIDKGLGIPEWMELDLVDKLNATCWNHCQVLPDLVVIAWS